MAALIAAKVPAMAEAVDSDAPVRRRQVFYVSGFDPKGPAWYYDLYAREAPAQAAVGGYGIAVGERGREGKFVSRWSVAWTHNLERVETVYDFLRWDDIMRRHWPRDPWRFPWLALKTYGRYVGTGVLWRVLTHTWATFLAGIYPALFLLALALAALALLALGAGGAALIGAPWWLGLAVALPVSGVLLSLGPAWLERGFGVLWLIRIYAFNLLQARRAVAGLDERIDLFARHIAAAARGDVDELLVIGHSTGAQLAVSVLARALALDPGLGRRGPRLSLLTLGGSLPMLGWQPGANWFKAEVFRLAREPRLDWLDFTTTQDGATFALLDPVVLLGLDPPDPPKPKILSTKLFQMFRPKTFKTVHRDWRRVHFQYLMAHELPGDYDFFAITAGPLTLSRRFAHRKPAQGYDRFKLKVFR